MPKKTKINIEENEVKEIPANPQTTRDKTPEEKVKKSMKEVKSNAYLTAQNIMGKADAEATEIYALSYGQSPEFYNYFKTLETYKNTLDSSTFFILSTDNKYFKFLEQ